MTATNVLIAIDHVTYDGNMHGGGRFFFDVVSRINPDKFHVVACVLRKEDSMRSVFERQGIQIRYLGRGRLDPFVLFDLVRIIRSERIHVLHLHGYGSQIFGRVAGVLTGASTIIHGHGIDFYPSSLQEFTDRCLSRFTARAIAVSAWVKEDYVQRRKMDPSKVLVMRNGIPIENFVPIAEQERREIKQGLGIQCGYCVVGTVTRLREEKGNRYFLEAAAEVLKVCPKTYFLLVGDGPLLNELRELAERLGIGQKVIFAGFQQDVARMLSIFDVKVIASLTEGLSLAVLEAMAMGKAVVATAVGGNGELLRDGETGLLVPPRDPEALAEKIICLLRNEQERARLGRRAHEESRRYGLDGYVRDLEIVYEEVAGKRVNSAGHREGMQ